MIFTVDCVKILHPTRLFLLCPALIRNLNDLNFRIIFCLLSDLNREEF